jgi:exosortase
MSTVISESEGPAQGAEVRSARAEEHNGSRLGAVLLVAAGCYLGLTLVNQLRIEWSLNEQYHYGWAVPFLGMFCAYRRRFSIGDCGLRIANSKKGEETKPREKIRGPVGAISVGLLFLILPIRLVQEANSDWRLVSWALAVTVVGLGCAATYLAGGARTLRRYAFALLFILVAVPWPTAIEQFLVVHLSGVNTGICVEVLGWFGIPAMQRGNLIELSTGMVEIEAACSGIRSLQAVVMAGLFFGELYRLNFRNRLRVFSIGVLLALVCNVARTVLLTWIAGTRGLPAMQSWHDPAGVGILLVCLTGLWGASVIAECGLRNADSKMTEGVGHEEAQDAIALPRKWARLRPSQMAIVLLWFGIVELATAMWYQSKEKNRPAPVAWTFTTPQQKRDFTPLEISADARRLLRFDHGEHARWRAENGVVVESSFFDWKPSRAAATLARDHTPDVCLPSAGRQIVANTNVTVEVQGLALPFRQFTVPSRNGVSYLFYCLWEDRAAAQSSDTEFTTASGRLRSVWVGRRNLGQRVLHVAIDGVNSAEEARAELKRVLQDGVRNERE